MARSWYISTLVTLFVTLQVFALPEGGHLGEGVAVQVHANELHAKASAARTVVDWESFSVGPNERVFFDLPSRQAAILNRVVGGSESQILGQITSNHGSVYLVNPNGIFIGKDAVINVGALIASTLRITNEDFFRGNDCFLGSTEGRIVHEGTIEASCGRVALLSHTIEGGGKIESGEILLASSDGVIIKTAARDGIEEEVKRDFYALAINHKAEEKPSLRCEDGRYFIGKGVGSVSLEGELKARRIDVVAKEVELGCGARVEGEIVRIGLPSLTERALVEPGAIVSGSEILIWGEQLAHVRGALFGGVVEVSKAPHLDEAQIETQHGYLIIDPPDITITHRESSSGVSESRGRYAFSGETTPLNINAGALEKLLVSNDVIIDASAGGSTAPGNGSITVGVPNGADGPIVEWDSDHSLTFKASPGGAIEFNEGVASTGFGSLRLIAKDVMVGKSDHSHTNAIDLSIGGELTVTFSQAEGSLGIYTGVCKEALVNAQGQVRVGRAEGITGRSGDLTIESMACKDPQNAKLSSMITGVQLDVGSVKILSSGLDASLESMGGLFVDASGDFLVQTTGSARQAYLYVTAGPIDITAASIAVSNSSTSPPQTEYAYGAFVNGIGSIDLRSRGPIIVRSENVGTYSSISTSDGNFTIHDCTELRVENTSSSEYGYTSLESNGMGYSSITTRGSILVSVGRDSQQSSISAVSRLDMNAGDAIRVSNVNEKWKGVAGIWGYDEVSLSCGGEISVSTLGEMETAYINSGAGEQKIDIKKCGGVDISGGFIGTSPQILPP